MGRFAYKWTLADANFTKDKGKVFSCFAGGGGSTMGYKLAGFDVIGCNEIDPRMNAVYVENHHPKHNFLMDIRELVTKAKAHELPEELYNLDILDGSPPCSSFSTSGDREKGWGKEKKFREGQANQILDTLFYDFIDLAKELQPKVIIAENVRGLTIGKARTYLENFIAGFEKIGYNVRYFVLDGQDMGLPQRRERVFFLCLRDDLSGDFMVDKDLFDQEVDIKMSFNEPVVPYKEIMDDDGRDITKKGYELWKEIKPGDRLLSDAHERLFGDKKWFTSTIMWPENVSPTLTGHEDSIIPSHKPKYTSRNEVCQISSFPMDYNFLGEKPHYICGMSVPPLMMANVAAEVYEQWLSKLK